MSDWPVGLSTGCFYQTSIFDCLEAIREGGFCMLEICSFPAHLDYRDKDAVQRATKRINELGLEPYSFHAPFADSIDITALDDDHRNHSCDEILHAAEAAARMEVRWFVIHPGPEDAYRPPAEEHIQRLNNAAQVLNRVAQRCRELGVGLVLENMLPHLLFGHMSDILWLLGALDTVSVGTCLDTGHAYLCGDVHNVMHKLAWHLQMIHANDNEGEFDDHLPPGDGRINWERLLAELSQTGFNGGFILELAGNREWQAILADARRARRKLRDISRHLDLSSPPTVAVADQSDLKS